MLTIIPYPITTIAWPTSASRQNHHHLPQPHHNHTTTRQHIYRLNVTALLHINYNAVFKLTMSFGFGVGDLIRVLELANEIRMRFVDAPKQYMAISDEWVTPEWTDWMLTVSFPRIKNLSNILDECKIVLPQRDLTSEQKEKFDNIIEGCQNVLTPLREILEKYQKLDSNLKSRDHRGLQFKIQKGWEKLTWKRGDVTDLRNRINSNVLSLNAFYGGLTTYFFPFFNHPHQS